jgi:succinate-semialdehyde dehydrogenase/glutarate-semialdehyde dehydrogenase
MSQQGSNEPAVLDDRLGEVLPLLFVGGTWREASNRETFAVTDPATDRVLAYVPNGTVEDAVAAVEAAEVALPTWKATPAPTRSNLLRRLFRLIIDNRDWLAQIISAEEGKPIHEALGEIAYGAGFIDWAADEGRRIYGETIPSADPNKRITVLRQGVGVTAAVTPWNFPLAMITRKLGPALAAGCTQVIKPAPETPLTAMALCALVEEAGFPSGSVNLITGPAAPVVESWLAHPAVRKLSFTGSTPVGKRLVELSAQNVTRLSLELGGHAPVIVFDDVDVELAVVQSVQGKFRNSGQSCISPNRFYVARSIYDEFVERFTAHSRALVTGPADRPDVAVGPLINDAAVAKVRRQVKDAVEHGATVCLGGDTVQVGDGYTDRFFAPTVLHGNINDALVCREETFGPVAPIVPFNDDDEAISWANGGPFGLAAYFFTNDVRRLTRVAEALDYGIIGINDCLPSAAQVPFGGVKQSGLGREGGRYVMDEYTEIKYLSLGI